MHQLHQFWLLPSCRPLDSPFHETHLPNRFQTLEQLLTQATAFTNFLTEQLETDVANIDRQPDGGATAAGPSRQEGKRKAGAMVGSPSKKSKTDVVGWRDIKLPLLKAELRPYQLKVRTTAASCARRDPLLCT